MRTITQHAEFRSLKHFIDLRPASPEYKSFFYSRQVFKHKVKSKTLLANTIIDANGQTKHQCPQCNRLYSHWHSMTRHLRLECGRPPQFKCGFCDFQSTRKGSINAHIAVKHASEAEKSLPSQPQQQRYQCSQCNKRFTYKVAMLKHRSACGLSDSALFSCPKCVFVATCSAELDTHVATEHYVL